MPIYTTTPMSMTTAEKVEVTLDESTTYRIGSKGTTTTTEDSNTTPPATDEGVEEMMETTTTRGDTGDRFGGGTKKPMGAFQDFLNKVVPPILLENPFNKKQKPIGTFSDPQQINSGLNSGEKMAQPIMQNVFNPPSLPSGVANPSSSLPTAGPLHLLNIRRFTRPLKRFFFPRLFSEDEKAGTVAELPFPSPIWLMVSSINQVLPVLRVIDHQMAPGLRYLQAITRPKYLDKLFGGDLNDQIRVGRHVLPTKKSRRRHPFYMLEDMGKVRQNENPYFPSLVYPRFGKDDDDDTERDSP